MALTHADHKRIAQSIATELSKVLSDSNGSRLMAKHKARLTPPVDPVAEPAPDEDMEAMMHSESPEEDLGETEPAPKHGGMPGMRGAMASMHGAPHAPHMPHLGGPKKHRR